VLGEQEAQRFVDLAVRLPELGPKELQDLTFTTLPGTLPGAGRPGFF
jgi:hypothetical protein